MRFHPLRFDRAARTYGAHAEVQDAMGRALLGLLPEGEAPAGILEFGCGTGAFSRKLRARFPAASLLATDAAPRMLEEARQILASGPAGAGRADFALLDAEGASAGLPGPVAAGAPYGLLSSNALVQWFPDLRAHFRLAAGLLTPGGAYLVSGFLRTNFPELNALLAEEPFGRTDFPGHSLESVAEAARGEFAVESLRAEDMERAYPSPEAFLEVIKGLGSARRPEEGRPLTRGALRLLARRYREHYPAAGGIRATWRPWYALLRKG